MRLLALAFAAVLLAGCASEQSGLKGEELEHIEAYRAQQAREFTVRFAAAKVNPRQADLQAIVTAEAINAPLRELNKKAFPVGEWTFTPTQAPSVELNTGSAILRITGDLQKGPEGRVVEVTLVGGLIVRWSEDGSHLFFKPTALAVVPTTHLSVLDFALGDYIRNFAQEKAEVYMKERIGEIDVPINLMLPVQRQALNFDQNLEVSPTDPPAQLHYSLPAATAEVRLKQLYVWPLEGRLVVLAYADVGDAPPPDAPQPANPPPTPDAKPDAAHPAPSPAPSPPPAAGTGGKP